MAVLVFAENWEGKFKKATYEAVSFAADAASKLNTEVIAAVIGNVSDDDCNNLGNYGASKVIRVKGERTENFSSPLFAEALAKVINDTDSELTIIPHTFNGKSLAGRTAAKINAGVVSGVVEGISTQDGVVAKKSVFSGKGFANVKIKSGKKIITLTTNSFGVKENKKDISIEDLAFTSSGVPKIEVLEQEKITGKIPLTEAEKVVSGGRGMKGPENWNLIEELADLIGAGTACSKPVSDMDWRPHSEHVGQTGITIRPNLYLAVGISGAIQHQAGVNSSKIIVVVNKDPEAPFFKIADYGIVGDAFEVLPKLIEAAKKLKASE